MSRSGNSRRGNGEWGMVGNREEWEFFPGLPQHIGVGTGVAQGGTCPLHFLKIRVKCPFEAYSDVLFCQPYNQDVPSNTQLLHE